MAEEKTDAADLSPEEEEPDHLLTDLLGELGREIATLVYYEGRLAASRNAPELKRAARDVVAAIGVVAALLTAFVLANASAVLALSTVMDGWLAALVLALAWSAVGALLALACGLARSNSRGGSRGRSRWPATERSRPWRTH